MKLIDPDEIVHVTEAFAALLRTVMDQYNMVGARIEELDRENSTIVHQFERPDCLYSERARLATSLQSVRIERRRLKDWQRAMKPIYEYMTTDRGPNIKNFVASFLGAARKAQQHREKCRF